MSQPSLHVDEHGLSRVLGEWSGIGGLCNAVAAMADEPFDREWSGRDVERRAMRILLLNCTPILRRWPRSLRIWQDHLPALTTRTRFWSEVPRTGVDWSRTRRTGWPPTAFAIRRRHRATDQVALTLLSWTLTRLEHAFEASRGLIGPSTASAMDVATDVGAIVEQSLPLLRLLDASEPERPTRDEVRAVKAAGWPWKVVAEAAEVFLAYDRGGAESLARQMLRPDGFPETIFQLSVVGVVLGACEEAGGRVTSLRPIGDMTDGPVYAISWGDGQESWDIWCEAAAAWSWYGLDDTYRGLTARMTQMSGQPFSARNIRPDVVIAAPGRAAVILECKFPSESLDPGYVGHGLYQAAFYAHQFAPVFPRVLGVSVGPVELVPTARFEAFGATHLGLASPTAIAEMVSWLRNLSEATPDSW